MVANAIPIVKTGKNPDSIKTRIETFEVPQKFHLSYSTQVRTLIPLKQG